jgi:hypothetical protein
MSARLSEATAILPHVRSHLVAAANGPAQATAVEVLLLPICEDGLLGYELVPDRETHTYVILGRNPQGEPVLRTTSYGSRRAGRAELVTVNGHLLSRAQRASRYSVQPRDYLLPDWTTAAEAALTQLRALFDDRPGLAFASPEKSRGFEHALSIAHSRLSRWDPIIRFFGIPNEADLGFALLGGNGEEGTLAFRPPDVWTLRWNAPPDAINESWSVVVGVDAVDGAGSGRNLPDRRRRNRRVTDRGGSSNG